MKKAFLALTACVILAGTASGHTGFIAVSELLGAHCAACHAWAGSYKGIADPTRVVASFPEKSLLYQVVASDRMPRSGAKLSAEEKALIRAWIAAGALPKESPAYPRGSEEQTAPVPEPCPCGLE